MERCSLVFRAGHLSLLIAALLMCGCWSCSSPDSVNADPLSLSDAHADLVFWGVYPNPVKDSATIYYRVNAEDAREVSCSIFSEQGAILRVFQASVQDSSSWSSFGSNSNPCSVGLHTIVWNDHRSNSADHIPNGVYYLDLKLAFSNRSIEQQTVCLWTR